MCVCVCVATTKYIKNMRSESSRWQNRSVTRFARCCSATGDVEHLRWPAADWGRSPWHAAAEWQWSWAGWWASSLPGPEWSGWTRTLWPPGGRAGKWGGSASRSAPTTRNKLNDLLQDIVRLVPLLSNCSFICLYLKLLFFSCVSCIQYSFGYPHWHDLFPNGQHLKRLE